MRGATGKTAASHATVGFRAAGSFCKGMLLAGRRKCPGTNVVGIVKLLQIIQPYILSLLVIESLRDKLSRIETLGFRDDVLNQDVSKGF